MEFSIQSFGELFKISCMVFYRVFLCYNDRVITPDDSLGTDPLRKFDEGVNYFPALGGNIRLNIREILDRIPCNLF